MPQSLSQIYVHLTFSTKLRRPFLRDRGICDALYGYLIGTCVNLGCPSKKINGWEDHIYIPCSLNKTMSVSELVREIKRSSSDWIKDQSKSLPDFYWQAGYGAFSVSQSHVETIQNYIANQAEHHRTETFQDEFRRLCVKYGVELDERYAWD
jgi:REP element-mobilizing transposase RayT